MLAWTISLGLQTIPSFFEAVMTLTEMAGEQSELKASAPSREAKHTVPPSLWHSKMPFFGYCFHTFPVWVYLSYHSWIVTIVCDKLWTGDDEVGFPGKEQN